MMVSRSSRFLNSFKRSLSTTNNSLFHNHAKCIHEIDIESPLKQLLSPLELKNHVRNEYARTFRSQSRQLASLPKFSKLLKGFRPGELTIFTGPTGSGKTTVLSQISLDLASQQIPILWGSFEVRNTRLLQAMLQQIATKPIPLEDISEILQDRNRVEELPAERLFEDAFKHLSELPVQFMNVFGSTPLEHVISLMETAVTQHSTQIIILDNLQFMLSGQGNSNFDKFDLLDRSISAVRAFCNRYPVHVILVVHPRKELDETPLGLCSVSGTAKATQEADNVIILQKLENDLRFLDLKKNRFDGELGRVKIGFARTARLIFEIDDKHDNKPN